MGRLMISSYLLKALGIMEVAIKVRNEPLLRLPLVLPFS